MIADLHSLPASDKALMTVLFIGGCLGVFYLLWWILYRTVGFIFRKLDERREDRELDRMGDDDPFN